MKDINSIEKLLRSDALQDILVLAKDVEQKKLAITYNIFNLSSVNNKKENFHSDIIAFLLNPEAKHGISNLFLELFIDYLNKHFSQEIKKEWFRGSSVEREKQRIDISIKNHDSKKAIIIENKIYDAKDPKRQLTRYYKKCTEQGYQVIALIYLSLDGLKQAPALDDKTIPLKPINIGAVTEENNDLVSGWLTPAKEASVKEDNSSFIYQYIKLLKSLAVKVMDNQVDELFYRFINKYGYVEEYKKINIIENLVKSLPHYRRNILLKAIKDDFHPFEKPISNYNNAVMLYEGYVDYNRDSYKLHIEFYDNGNAKLVFWIPLLENEKGLEFLSEKLKSIDWIDKLNANKEIYKYDKDYFYKDYSTIQEIDEEVVKDVKDLMKKLNNK